MSRILYSQSSDFGQITKSIVGMQTAINAVIGLDVLDVGN